jgi:hypothetical protein
MARHAERLRPTLRELGLACPSTLADWHHLARIAQWPPEERLRAGDYTIQEICDHFLAWVDRERIKACLAAGLRSTAAMPAAGGQADAAAATPNPTRDAQPTPPAPGRRRKRGHVRLRLIWALQQHHGFDRSTGKPTIKMWAPIRHRVLVTKAEAGKATVSEFFADYFGSYADYKVACSNESELLRKLTQMHKDASRKVGS